MSRAVWSQTLDGLKGWWLGLTVESAVRGTVRSRDEAGGGARGNPENAGRGSAGNAILKRSIRADLVAHRSFLCHPLHGAMPTTFRPWNITDATTLTSIHNKLAGDVTITLSQGQCSYSILIAFLIACHSLPLQAS